MTIRDPGVTGLRRALRAYVRRAGGYTRAARALELAPGTVGYLCQIVHGQARPSQRIARALGFTRTATLTYTYRRAA